MNASLALVTGATGWLGRRLVDALARERAVRPDRVARIRCLAEPGAEVSALSALGVEVVRGDLRDPAAMDRFVDGAAGATLYHSAGLIHPRRRTSELADVNVRGTGTLLGAATRARVRRWVQVSSSAAVESPLLAYGASKRRAEELVTAAQRAGDIEAVVLRPPWFYGPGHPPRQTRFIHMIARGLAPVVGRGDAPRAMVYLDNLCQALLLAAHSASAPGRCYWIADRRDYSLQEIVGTVKTILTRDFGERVAPWQLRLPALAGAATSLADRALQSVGIYQQELHVLGELSKTIAGTNEPAERELGYRPEVDLEEGMRRSIRWMRDHRSR